MNKTIIIESIGQAEPNIVSVLADVFGVSNELVVKMLYCTPSVFLNDVPEDFAIQAHELLEKLGLVVSLKNSDEPLPAPPTLLDVAVYVHQPTEINNLAKQLSIFLACSEQEALNLLLAEPSVILGGISMNTAEALSQRIAAEVMVSDPQKARYTLRILNNNPIFIQKLQAILKNHNILFDANKDKFIPNMSFEICQAVWRFMNNTSDLLVYNQDFQRYELVLTSVDYDNTAYRRMLTEGVGMPDDIIDTVLQNLPIVLEESVSYTTLVSLLEQYKNAGLNCTFEAIPFGDKKIIIENINDTAIVEQILKPFYESINLKQSTKKWVSPTPINPLFSRYLVNQLESLDCQVKTELYEYAKQ